MHILFLAGRELSYPRNDVLLRALRDFAHVDVFGPLHRPRSLVRSSLQVTGQALKRLGSESYDAVFVGFYGYLLMLPVGLLARRRVLE